MEQLLTFRLEDFEGPLDLLLHLVSKNKMNLYEIEIVTLIDQYTSIIATIQENRLEIASEFIEMAARLVQMKSYFLLPKSQEAERMKQELEGELIEYSLCKQIAGQLALNQKDISQTLRSPMDIPQNMLYTLHHPAYILRDALRNALGNRTFSRQPTQEQFEPIVTAPFVSVTSKVVFILRGLVSGKLFCLGQLFSANRAKSESVATFLATLELIHSGRIVLHKDQRLLLKNAKKKE